MLPNRLAYKFAGIERWGMLIVFALLFLKLLHYWVLPVSSLGNSLLEFLVRPLYLLLS